MVFDYDIIIIGAGPAGISAAGTLKKQGLKVALLEKTSQIGGSYYASMTNLLKPGPESVLFSEIKSDLCAMQGFELIDPTTLNDRYFGYIEGHDIELFLENNVYGAQVVMGNILSVDVSGPEGNRTLSAKAFIDASGGVFLRTIKPRKAETSIKSITVLAGGMGIHSDIKQRIAALAGYINESMESISVEISPTINKGLYHIRITGDGEEIRKALPSIMKRIEDFDGASKDVFLIHGAGELYSEDIYTQDAKYILEQNDIAQGRRFEDSVIEGDTGAGLFYIPYRSMLPMGINNLLLCGRSIGARRGLSAVLDTAKTAYATGQAAALAALNCMKSNLPLDQADIDCISNPFIGVSQDFAIEEDAEIYIENIDVEDLVELAPEDESQANALAGDRPVQKPEEQECQQGFVQEVPEFDGAVYGAEEQDSNFSAADEREYKQSSDAMPDEYAWKEFEEAEQDDDKPFFTEEKLMNTIQNPIYDLISDDVEEGLNTAGYEKAAGDANMAQEQAPSVPEAEESEHLTGYYEMTQKPFYGAEPASESGMEAEQGSLAKSIEKAAEDVEMLAGASDGQEEEVLEFPEEDIIDKLPAYMLFDDQNNAIDFSNANRPQTDKTEEPKEKNSVDELLSLLDVLPDQLPEGLYDFLKENSKAHKRDDEVE